MTYATGDRSGGLSLYVGEVGAAQTVLVDRVPEGRRVQMVSQR